MHLYIYVYISPYICIYIRHLQTYFNACISFYSCIYFLEHHGISSFIKVDILKQNNNIVIYGTCNCLIPAEAPQIFFFLFCPTKFILSCFLLPPPKAAVSKMSAESASSTEGEGNPYEGMCFASIIYDVNWNLTLFLSSNAGFQKYFI